MKEARFSIAQLNALPRAEFVRVIGPVFESSPWLAEGMLLFRPFASSGELEKRLCTAMWQAAPERQLALVRAHPDLAVRLAQQGRLTAESSREQAAAGLDQLGADELAGFEKLNRQYRDKFGFPFIICARLNKVEAILNGFVTRLNNSREEEIKTALAEIAKIASLRLRDLIQN